MAIVISRLNQGSGLLSTPRVELSDKSFTVAVADEPKEQEKGLSGKNNLPKNRGMLFVFGKPDYYSFWMKDMKFPIDIIWIDENLRIINIEKNITPDTFPKKFIPQLPAKYVLEVNGGWSDKNEIKEGVNIKVKP